MNTMTIANRLTAHRGDPCVWCGTPHDEAAPGPCPCAPSAAMVADALVEIERCADGERFRLERLEAQALLEALTR
jgi:hypothetical protein